MKNLSIRDWVAEDRPRERLEELGARALSDAELLSILVNSGTKEHNAVELMKEVLASCGNNLNTLGKKTVRELQQIKGVGKAKATIILAALELGKRRAFTPREYRTDLGSATAIYNYMLPYMQDLPTEEFDILLMNQDYKLIKKECIATGGLTEVTVDVRVIMKECILNNATILAVCHNHPSGSLHPSRPDDSLTRSISKACDTLRIYFLDHVIITDGDYYSYRESGRI